MVTVIMEGGMGGHLLALVQMGWESVGRSGAQIPASFV